MGVSFWGGSVVARPVGCPKTPMLSQGFADQEGPSATPRPGRGGPSPSSGRISPVFKSCSRSLS